MVATKVAIIGCGVGGLAAIKSCLDAGLQPTCFELQSRLGGVWNYTDGPRPNLGSVHSSTITNVSKANLCFSDFPVPREFPNYVHHAQFLKYLEMYAKNFELEQYVKFNAKVERLSKTEDHKETGRWTVSYTRNIEDKNVNNGSQGKTTYETFDAVMVCTGHHFSQSMPKLPGMERFRGVQIHSGDYRTFHPYVGKRVVIVGCSYSSGDVASELSHHAEKVYLSVRSGGYFVKRLVPGTTRPFDHQVTRYAQFVQTYFQRSLFSGFLSDEYNMASLGLQPSGTLGVDQFIFIDTDLPQKIITGRVTVKGDIKELRETSVVLVDGEVLDNIDAVIYCTGFRREYLFASDIIKVEDEYYVRLCSQVIGKHGIGLGLATN